MKPQIVLATLVVCIVAWTAPAYGFFETNSQPLAQEWWNSTFEPSASCSACHSPGTTNGGTGPHGGYTATTRACQTCHNVHDATGSLKLLPGDTVKDSCGVCHDGTGGRGVYGTLAVRGVPVGADHSTETTNVVPGGSASTGGSATMVFSGMNDTLTCSDCHSPHGSDTVTAFLGERQRAPEYDKVPVLTTSRLLKRKPGGVATPVNDYGSDWCLACHAGRVSGTAGLHNHPVESSVTKPSPQVPYNYRELGIVGVGPYPTSATVLGPGGIDSDVPGYNRAYLMPYPRTGAQAGHLPICQQCHEDTRNVGTLSTDGTQATPSVFDLTGYPAGDGLFDTATDNPRFQNFPHETEGYRLLVEATTTGSTDDLCLNCHPTAALP